MSSLTFYFNHCYWGLWRFVSKVRIIVVIHSVSIVIGIHSIVVIVVVLIVVIVFRELLLIGISLTIYKQVACCYPWLVFDYEMRSCAKFEKYKGKPSSRLTSTK